MKLLLLDISADQASLDRRLKKEFPNRPLPYPPKVFNKLAKFLGIEDANVKKLLRYELRLLSLEILRKLRDRKFVTRSDIQKEIDRSIIKPIDRLSQGIVKIDKIGGEEAYALANEKGTYVNVERLLEDLKKFKAWSEQAKLKSSEPTSPKGITGVRQDFVDHLFKLYHIYTDKNPSRSPQSDQHGNWYEDGEFSRFVDMCAEPIFEIEYNFTRQIKVAQSTHKEWLTAGRKRSK